MLPMTHLLMTIQTRFAPSTFNYQLPGNPSVYNVPVLTTDPMTIPNSGAFNQGITNAVSQNGKLISDCTCQ